MNQQDQDKRIDYIEFQAVDVQRAKTFYSKVFGWAFNDYGDTYTSFNDGRSRGGFQQVPAVKPTGTLIVLYARDLDAMKKAVTDAGGKITKEIFEFPGGKRFHFTDSESNELAVWSE